MVGKIHRRNALASQAIRLFYVTRALVGLLFCLHGLMKLFGILGGSTVELGSQLWFGAIIEVAAGVLVCTGWYATYAAFIASGTMAVAYIQFHWKLQFDENFSPWLITGNCLWFIRLCFSI